MKKISIAISLIIIISSCKPKTDNYVFKVVGSVETTKGSHDAIWYTNELNFDGDTLYYTNTDSSKVTIHPPYEIYPNEKHFDCMVDLCIKEGAQYRITTECGIVFYTDYPIRIGETFKNFESPKHK